MSEDKDNLNEISDEELLKEVEEILEKDKKNLEKDKVTKEDIVKENINEEEVDKNVINNEEIEEDEIDKIKKKLENIDSEEINENKIVENKINKEDDKLDSIEIIKNKKTKDICDMIQKKIPDIDEKDLEILKKVIEKEKNKSKYIEKSFSIEKILKILFYIGISLLVILILSVMFIKIKYNYSYKNSKYILKNTIKIRKPLDMPNNSKYIYISKDKKIGEDTFNLIKLLIDYDKIIFYFDKPIDLNKYNVRLEDGTKFFYDINLNNKNKNNLEFIDMRKRNIDRMILHIEKEDTKEKIDFIFKVKGKGKKTKIENNVYVDSIDILKNNKFNFKLNKSVFSSANTEIDYSIYEKENSNLIFERVNIIQGSIDLPLKEKDQFRKDNIILGKLIFSPLYSLKDNIQIKFSNVYENSNINKEIEINKLFKNSEDSQIKIEDNNKTIILERIGFINENCILVMHGVDENNNRIEFKLNAVIKYIDEFGNKITLEGISKSKTEGTDMIFNISNKNIDIINNPFILDIKSIKYKKDDIVQNISLHINKKEDLDDIIYTITKIKDFFEEKGFRDVSPITYMELEEYKILGVFIARKDKTVYKYFVTYRKNGYNISENCDIELISEKNINKQ